MNYTALVIGMVLSFLIINRFQISRLESKSWAYPVLLATFPFYYWVFAVYGADYTALRLELLIGVIFFAIAFSALKFNKFFSTVLLSFGFILHGIYDIFHNYFFLNAGTPGWWPEFCGIIDLIIGGYVAYLGFTSEAHNSESV